jgi:hypothetical protein
MLFLPGDALAYVFTPESIPIVRSDCAEWVLASVTRLQA